MNKRKLKDVAEISRRQFRRRVHNAVTNIMDKVNYENRTMKNINNAVPSNATIDTLSISSMQCTSKAVNVDIDESWQICEKDPKSDSLIIYNDLHTDSPPESDYKVASLDYEFLNYGICENEQNKSVNRTTLDSSLKDIEDNDLEKTTSELRNFLRNWTIINGVKSCAVSDLLSHLKKYPYFATLPKDAKTLLHTPRKCDIIDVQPGKYCHFDLTNGIIDTLSNDSLRKQKCKLQGVHIAIGIDGLPLSKSSSSQLMNVLIIAAV